MANETMEQAKARWRDSVNGVRDIPSGEIPTPVAGHGTRARRETAPSVISENTKVGIAVGTAISIVLAVLYMGVRLGELNADRNAILKTQDLHNARLQRLEDRFSDLDKKIDLMQQEQGHQTEDLKTLLRHSDAMLYAAGGKNRASRIPADN